MTKIKLEKWESGALTLDYYYGTSVKFCSPNGQGDELLYALNNPDKFKWELVLNKKKHPKVDPLTKKRKNLIGTPQQ